MKVTECTARTLRQGDAISELEAQGEDLEIAMAKAERALEGIGVSIRGETADSLRDIEDIVGDVADAWDTLSDSERQAVSEAMAGTQRSSMFSALIENYDKVLELQDEGLNSFGELAEANQKRVESFEGQLNILKDKMLAFTDGLQPLIFGSVELSNNLLDLINDFGAIPTVVGLASASFLSFSDSGQKVKNTLMEMVGAKIQLVDGFNQIISAQNQRVESAKNEVAIAKQQISSTIETIAKLRLEHSARNDNTEAIAKQQQALVGLNKGLVASQKELAIATLKATAFQTVLSLGLSAAISGAIILIGKIAEELKDFAWSSEEAKEALGTMQDSLEEYNNLQVKTKETEEEIINLKSINEKIKDNTVAYNEQEGLINTIQEKLEGLANSYPSMASVLKSDNIELETKIKLLERQLELEEKQASMKAMQDLGGNVAQKIENGIKEQMDDIEYAKETLDLINKGKVDIGQLDSANQMIEEAKIEIEALLLQSEVAKATLETALSHGLITEDYYQKQVEKLDSTIEKYKEYGSGVRETTESVKNDSKNLVESAINDITSLSDSLAVDFDSEASNSSLTSLKSSLSELEEGSDEAKEVLTELKDTFEDMPSDVDTLAEAIDYLNGKLDETSESVNMKDLNESYLESLESIKEAKDLLDSFDEGLDVSEMRSLFDSELLADYNGALTDTVALQDHLKSKIGEMEAQGLLAYANLKGENESFWTSANANSEDYFNNTIKNTSLWESFTKQVNENLALIHSTMVNSMGSKYENYFNDIKTAYGIDLSNCKTAAEARIKIEAEAAEKIAQMRKAISQASYDYGTVVMPDGTEVNYGEYHETPDTSKFNEAIAQIQAWKNQAIGALSQVGQFQDTVFNSTTTKPSSGSSSSNKGSSSSNKEVEDLDLQIDRYYDLQDAIDDVNNALDKNQTLQERATGVEKAKLMKEEIQLYKDLQKATQDLVKEQQKERDELKKTISSYGGTFDSNGDLKDRKKWLEGLQAQVNKLSGEAKEAKKEEVEALMSVIEKYEELHNDTIPATQLEYEELANTIKDLEKEQLEYVTDIQKDITSAIEDELKKRYDKLKSSLEKEKDLYNSQFDKEDHERNLATYNREIAEIQQQIADLARDTSLAGQLKREELEKELAQKQEEFNNYIRDYEKEQGNNRFDEELDKLDEELEKELDPQNIADMVNKALVDGFVTIGSEVIKLDNLMSNWLDETGDGLYAIGELLNSELIANLKTAQTLMGTLGISSVSSQKTRTVDIADTSIAKQRTLNNDLEKSNFAKTRTQSVHFDSLVNVEGNLTEEVFPKVESMLNEGINALLNSLAQEMSFK